MIEYQANLKPDWTKGNGLLPCIVQDYSSGRVLMLAYFNEQSLEKSLSHKKLCFYSRSRNELWTKGETSGNFLHLMRLYLDCDKDTFLAQVDPVGPACHRNTITCFDSNNEVIPSGKLDFLLELEKLIACRQQEMPQGSYTTSLFEAGLARIAQKVGEEGLETALAGALEQDNLIDEAADLIYHLSVLLAARNSSLSDVVEKLKNRHGN